MNTRAIGQKAESFAFEFLKKGGMLLLSKNYVTPYGEADAIFRDGEEFVFVEVKARKRMTYGTPAEAVTKSKMKRYLQIAQYYFLQNGIEDYAVRFDVVEVYTLCEPPVVNHIKNAFDFSGFGEFY